MDEFEIEVTDLRPRKAPAQAPTQASTAGMPSAPAEPAEDDQDDLMDALQRAPLPPLTRLRPALAASLRGRGRQLRGLGVALALLLAALIVLTGVPTSREALVAALNIPTPVPTATLDAGADLIFVTHDVPWSELTIDGKAQPSPRPTRQNNLAPYALTRGQHTVAFRAAPFPTLRCRISVPAAGSDTCPLDRSQQDPGVPLNALRILDLGAVPSRLSAANRASLISAANRLLASQQTSTTLQPGEHYLALDGTTATAQEPLRATLISALATPGANGANVNGGQCAPFCDDGFGGPGTPADGWPLLAQVSTTWSYTFPDGHTVEGPGVANIPGGPPDINFVPLEATWRDGRGGWRVSPYRQFPGGEAGGPFGGFVCGLASTEYSALPQDPSSVLFQNTSSQCLTGQNPADGCVIAATPGGPDGTGNGDVTDKTMLFLYRFGLLYAANDQAHQALPSLATANADQQVLAQQIVKESGMVAGGGG